MSDVDERRLASKHAPTGPGWEQTAAAAAGNVPSFIQGLGRRSCWEEADERPVRGLQKRRGTISVPLQDAQVVLRPSAERGRGWGPRRPGLVGGTIH